MVAVAPDNKYEAGGDDDVPAESLGRQSAAVMQEFDTDGDGKLTGKELHQKALEFRSTKRRNIGLVTAVVLMSVVVLMLLGIIAVIMIGRVERIHLDRPLSPRVSNPPRGRSSCRRSAGPTKKSDKICTKRQN